MPTFVVAHGAWSARPGLEENVSADSCARASPVYANLYWARRARASGECDVNLDCHIADILGVLEFEDLSAVNLMGHSHGGMVATGVLPIAPTRVSPGSSILDAFAPCDGNSVCCRPLEDSA